MNLKDESLTRSFSHFQIKELNPSSRNELISKWTSLTDTKNDIRHRENDNYDNIDKTTELVNSTLGKVIGSGIMPAYPFFILSVISSYETLKPLNQEITSQGHCYQALIYCALRKQGIKSDEIDTYINFLTVFAFHFFEHGKQEVSQIGFEYFMKNYLDEYNLPVKEQILLKNLLKTQIISKNSLGNYSFCYPYLYYFFVAKYLAEHLDKHENIIKKIISNLHANENAYITIFISHHSKNIQILEEIAENADDLFKKHQPASLDTKELAFFDENVENIVKAALPPPSSDPEKTRQSQLQNQDAIEEVNTIEEKDFENDEIADELEKELRRSIKTAEVMGQIIKNRAGSLEKKNLEGIFEKAMDIHFRALSSFFELIKEKNQQEEIVKFISNRLENYINNTGEQPGQKELEKLSRIIFWNMNFFLVYSVISKIIHSLGSDKLTSIIEKICNEKNTPASFIVKHGISMWYNKNLQVEPITKRIRKDDFSKIAKRVLDFKIAGHSSMHFISYKDRQKIRDKLKIPLKINVHPH